MDIEAWQGEARRMLWRPWGPSATSEMTAAQTLLLCTPPPPIIALALQSLELRHHSEKGPERPCAK